jgi:hypothetical protein
MKNPWAVVVAIVADERHNGVTGLVKEKFYVPHRSGTSPPAATSLGTRSSWYGRRANR